MTCVTLFSLSYFSFQGDRDRDNSIGNSPFRTTTDNPFRRPSQGNSFSDNQDFDTQQQNLNSFQNNEQGSSFNSPINPLKFDDDKRQFEDNRLGPIYNTDKYGRLVFFILRRNYSIAYFLMIVEWFWDVLLLFVKLLLDVF